MPKTLSRLLLSTLISLCSFSAMDAWSQPETPSAIHEVHVKLTTSEGDIVLALEPEKAPKTVANFVQYVKEGNYNGTVFHRVINGFMIQGGGYTSNLKEKPTHAPIPLETSSGLKNERGTIAMARTMAPNSATNQFFINVVDNANLDSSRPNANGYAVFGHVISGMEVVDKIKAVPTNNRGIFHDVPVSPVVITSVNLID
jgi:peptidyl-prolyl cis-trans isomerase A (cyclophilin A)